jgi:hypothetical protein
MCCFYLFATNCCNSSCQLRRVCLSVCSYLTIWEPVNVFLLCLVLGSFAEICRQISVLVKFDTNIVPMLIFAVTAACLPNYSSTERKMGQNCAYVLCWVHFYASVCVVSGIMKQKNTLMLWGNFLNVYTMCKFPVLLYFDSFHCTCVSVLGR